LALLEIDQDNLHAYEIFSIERKF